jgi:hypothetical protein
MTNEECLQYILSKNLDLRSIEQIVSFFFDNDIRFTGKLNWWEKKNVTQAFHGDNFINIWPVAIKAIEAESLKRSGLKIRRKI